MPMQSAHSCPRDCKCARSHASEANAAAPRTIAHIAHRTVRSPQLTLQAMCLEPRTLHSTPLHSLLAISRLERGGVYGAARFMNDRKSLANCACVLLVPRARAVACVCAIRRALAVVARRDVYQNEFKSYRSAPVRLVAAADAAAAAAAR